MARGKTKLTLIEAEKKLRTTFLKRKKGLIKKVEELTILCDVIACVIIYGPVLGGRPREIFTWPVEQHRVRAAIKMYKEKMDHSRRTADLCNYLKDRKRAEAGEAGGGRGGSGFRVGSIRPDVAVAYLKWVDARIRAVEERIEFVKSGGRSVMLGDNMTTMMVPTGQDQSFGYESVQEWMVPYDQALWVHSNNGLLCTNGVFDHVIQFQPQEPNLGEFHHQNQTQNQMVLYDTYLQGIEQNYGMGMHVNSGGGWCHQQQPLYGETMQFSDSVAVAQPPMMSYNMDGMMQQLRRTEEWSSPEAASSNQSPSPCDPFNKAAALDAVPSCSFEEQLEYLFTAAEFCDEIQPQGDRHGGGVPSCHNGF
uniref:MADS-box domain-containing protein n=1 Tax=Kalanchoe fedtschenkoi TaxID=63787 RepID=A0A7N0TRZ2_KALFE